MKNTDKKQKTYIETHGNPENPTLIFLHGAGLDHKTWKPQIKPLKKQYHLILLDLPEHGESQKNQVEFSFQKATENIHNLIKKHEIKTTTLIGQSLGGLISQHYTDQHPEKIDKLILLGSPSLHHGFNDYTNTLLKIHSKASHITPWDILKETATTTLAKKPWTRQYIRETLEKTGKEQLLLISEGTKKGIEQGIPSPIKKPILLTYGQKEMTFIKKQMANWHEKHPESRLKPIPDAGHLANQDNPKKFNEAIKNYLTQQKT